MTVHSNLLQQNTQEQPCELARIEYPERVLEIHQEYIEAGLWQLK
ncbi:MAG: hypothetical protein ACLRRA_02880 [Acutalibacteraceae bacterium]